MTRKEFNRCRRGVSKGHEFNFAWTNRLIAYTHQRNVRIRQLERQIESLNSLIRRRNQAIADMQKAAGLPAIS